MNSPLFPCIPLYSPVFPCIPLYSLVIPCIPQYSPKFPCIPFSSPVFPCILLYSLVYMHAWCMHSYIHTYIHTYIRTYVHKYLYTYIRTHIYVLLWNKYRNNIRLLTYFWISDIYNHCDLNLYLLCRCSWFRRNGILYSGRINNSYSNHCNWFVVFQVETNSIPSLTHICQQSQTIQMASIDLIMFYSTTG